MLPQDLIPKAESAIDREELREHAWNQGAIRLVPNSHSWVAKHRSFDGDEFLFALDFEHNGRKYTIYHAPKTGKYNENDVTAAAP